MQDNRWRKFNMKQVTITLSILLTLLSCKSTFEIVEKPTDYSIVIEKGRVRGVVFSKDGSCFLCLQDKERFTPTIDQIEKAEAILKQNLEQANSQLINQVDNCPIIHNNLKNYRRQYFGYIDSEGNKVIYATFNWERFTLLDRIRGNSKDDSAQWKIKKEMVLDGCSHHWEIKINLDTEELFDLGVNGLA